MTESIKTTSSPISTAVFTSDTTRWRDGLTATASNCTEQGGTAVLPFSGAAKKVCCDLPSAQS